MDELERIRQARMKELQAQQAPKDRPAADEAAMKAQKEQALIESVLNQILTPEARQRFENVRISRPEFAMQLARQLVSLSQSGQIRAAIDDAGLKALLARLAGDKREPTITRK